MKPNWLIEEEIDRFRTKYKSLEDLAEFSTKDMISHLRWIRHGIEVKPRNIYLMMARWIHTFK